MKHYARSRAWCEWQDFAQWQTGALEALGAVDGEALPPFHLLSLPGITAAQQQACATRWMAERLDRSQANRDRLALEFAGNRAQRHERRDSRIRLGYLSSDFQQHATALLMVEMLEFHNPQRFELHAYSYGRDDGSDMRLRLKHRFEHFTDISALDDVQAARAIHDDGIDILIDLKGYTAGTRTMLLTYRPAPVQVSYLGYPGTLGGGFCDYLISDRFITPSERAGDYSEALACMPHSYQPHGRQVSEIEPPSRAAAGLPGEGLVMCCFNQAYKFTPQVFEIWCHLLALVPDSVLWLLSDEQAQGNLRREALQRGVAPHRLVFAPQLPQAQHLARLSLADLVLDTSPYNAHTTASDALWAGVPVLTCSGDTFASRVAGSLLHAVGLPELVTFSLPDYAQRAIELLTDPPRLLELRHRLGCQRALAPLFNVEAYTRHLEALYIAMWQRHQDGLMPCTLGPMEATSREDPISLAPAGPAPPGWQPA
ncbi:MAG TPA: UDP-N-acetylglucosamine-peptide N-acetylglucosaminyltransferase [Aquabacterium sp.]|uniref:O-linked N-acetylglucosamine transferase, SPINDLY family protein n=1 Tax=Aquabacterium sp. TaxID=1872578 RepID=UPI002E36A15A|nr:UDP-N-acetylglucosamine-peptide N-acetylglucosaminyltransferase [Aquabacterium sp.]HEX5374054.1 UDP-N-acetylglucosamine-peptide N-acetylglucosaminyltransferase [Aquabacterium sp.]